ncbi:hypothetical protein ALC62_07986, partial [Cyphomyrmex costatus]
EDWTVSSDDTEAGAQRGVIRYVVYTMLTPTRLKGQLTPSCLASYSRCARSSFPPHFSGRRGDSSCIPLPRTYNGSW